MKNTSHPFPRINRLIRILLILGIVFLQDSPTMVAQAAPSLSIIPLTWNVIGLDSNNVNVGPNNFPVGARVCNTGAPVTNLLATFYWDSSNANINLRQGSLSSIALDTLDAGTPSTPTCVDFYFEVTVTRTPAAYDTTRQYHISVTSPDFSTLTTPTPREIYIEHLISQNRNSTNLVKLDGVPYPAGSTMSLQVGNTYTIELDGSTAVQGYNQVEEFLNLPNTIFQILSVATHYTADSSTFVANSSDKLYGDACLYDPNPASPTYRSCIGSDGKVGGSIITSYRVKIIGGAGTNQSLGTLIYDFSGSSYHYNSDFSTAARYIAVSSPLTVTEAFTPGSIQPGGESTISISITNHGSSAVTGLSLTDVLPTSPAQMTVAADPAASTSAGCVNPSITATSGDTPITYTGDVAANSTCTISVNVTAGAEGTYVNTSGHLMVNQSDTGAFATASLTAASPQSGTGFCSSGVSLAHWTVPGTTTNPPDQAGGLPTTQDTNVTTAAASVYIPGYSSIITNSGHGDTFSWESYGYQVAGDQYIEFTLDTSKFRNITMSFWVANPGAGNGPDSITLSYNNGAGNTDIQTINSPATGFTQHTQNFNSLTNTSGNTTFRLTAAGANNNSSAGALLYDDISFTGTQITGCSAVPAMPTLEEAFLTSPIAVNGNSTLHFTLGNTNPSPLTGVSFTETLPTGLTVPSGSSSVCSGTLTTTAPGNISFSGGTIPGSGSCTIDVGVTGVTTGSYTTSSGPIASAESGTNSTSTGYGTASLTVLAPPAIALSFSPNPIYSDGTSTLTFTVINPNAAADLSGVSFADALPSSPGILQIAASPNASTSGCGTPTYSPAPGDTSISFSGGSIAAGSACTVKVDVTASATGSYSNTTDAVSSTNAGTGNTASDTLGVQTLHPGISILKQASTSPSGPWSSVVLVGPGDNVYYRLTIENIGDAALSPVSATDPTLDISSCRWPDKLPVGTTTVDPTASCVIGPVSPQAGTNPNTATAHGTYSGSVYDSAPKTATYATTVLTLEKSAAEASFTAAGDLLHYAYLVTNTGSTPIAGPLTVSDNNTSVTCPVVASLGAGENLTCTGVYTVSSFDMAVGSVSNTAYALLGSVYSNTARKIVYRNLPDLVIHLSNDTNGYASPGTPFTWTLTVSNNGPMDATFNSGETIFSDQLPAGATYSNLTVETGTNISDAGNIHCSIDGSNLLTCLASGGSVTVGGTTGSIPVSVQVIPDGTGSLVNSATVTPDNLITEGNQGNNTGSDAINVITQEPTAFLEIDKSDHLSTVAPDQTITYSIVVSNAGPSAADGAVVVDPAAAGITVNSVTCGSPTGSAACPSSSLVTVDNLQHAGIAIPTLPASSSVTFDLSATVTASSGSITNTASLISPSGVTNSNAASSAQDIDTVSSEPGADLAVTIDNGVSVLSSGGTTSFIIHVLNNGPTTVTGAVLTGFPAVGLNAVSVACSTSPSNRCSAAPDLGDLTTSGVSLPALAAGEFYEVSLEANVTAASGSLNSTASILLPNGVTDPNPGNNDAADTDTVISNGYTVFLPQAANMKDESVTHHWDGTLGFEDLPLPPGKNDFDYNDWVVEIHNALTYPSATSNLVKQIDLSFLPQAHGAEYDHQFQLLFPAHTFASDGTAILTITDQNDQTLSTQIMPFAHGEDHLVTIFPKTSELVANLGANTIEGKTSTPALRSADLRIIFDSPFAFPVTENPFGQPHGEGLFFDPILKVMVTGEQIRQGDVRLLSVPVTQWAWPEEGVRIDRAYPSIVYTPGTPPSLAFPTSWWTNHNHCVYDGVPCDNP